MRKASSLMSAGAAIVLAAARHGVARKEKLRLAAALSTAPGILRADVANAAMLFIAPRDNAAAAAAIRRFGCLGDWTSDGRFALRIGTPEENDRALAAFGAFAEPARRRRAEVRRETRETRIAAAIDLDQADGSVIATGVGFFDHMLAQVAAHGGFSLTLACEGDLDIDPHHTIEDCALVFGEALRGALGDRRGISRFGFSAPMDEADAAVLIDLSGRPYLKFEGAFRAAMIGAYPTEMTEHVFRSIATSLGAAIHVRIRGENDHHKTEVAFKAFGRALRTAIRIEGDTLPSTKGRL
jgi:imidazoleglycerol phosphate dehydratase HisB